MTSLKLTLAALVLGSALSPALADTNVEGRLVPAAQAAQAAAPLQEGRQAAPITTTAPLSDGERLVIERNRPR